MVICEAKTKSMMPTFTESIVTEMDRIPVAANSAIVEMLLIRMAKRKPTTIQPIPSQEVPLIVDGVAKTKTVIYGVVSPTTKIQPALT
jgi:hypothetical protein